MASLEEKREIKKATEGWLPEKNRELGELSGGGTMAFTVDWTTFEGDLQGLNWLEFNGPQQVVNAFRMIGTDDLGREALRETVRSVALRNTKEPEDKALAFADGVLTVTCAFARSPGGRFTDNEIRDFLMARL